MGLADLADRAMRRGTGNPTGESTTYDLVVAGIGESASAASTVVLRRENYRYARPGILLELMISLPHRAAPSRRLQ